MGSSVLDHPHLLNRFIFLQEGPGVLVLSEFAGSAQSLSGAIRINPWNTEEVGICCLV